MRMMCRGRPSASASASGFSTARPMIGSTISENFAGWAVADAQWTVEAYITKPTGYPVISDAIYLPSYLVIVAGLLTTTAGYATERRQLRRAPGPDGEDPPSAGEARVLMVTPRSPLGQGGVERHVMEVGRRVAAAN